VGDSTVTVANSAGTQLGSASFSVPLPQATFVVASSAGLSGNLVLTLDPSKARATVDNFLRYVNDGFYAGTVIHRVVPGFVVQGGGYLAASAPGAPVLKTPRPPIALETSGGLSNTRLSVAMARGPAADSATSQFFINLADNSGTLDATSTFAGYAVFGSLTAGQDVLALITAAPCSPIPGFSECAPSPEIVITSASQTR
jgi:cyclophilin family peptidyl-prolyl cis-trans isomerase